MFFVALMSIITMLFFKDSNKHLLNQENVYFIIIENVNTNTNVSQKFNYTLITLKICMESHKWQNFDIFCVMFYTIIQTYIAN